MERLPPNDLQSAKPVPRVNKQTINIFLSEISHSRGQGGEGGRPGDGRGHGQQRGHHDAAQDGRHQGTRGTPSQKLTSSLLGRKF